MLALASVPLVALLFSQHTTNVIAVKGVTWHVLVFWSLSAAAVAAALRARPAWRMPRAVAAALVFFVVANLLSAAANPHYPGPMWKHLLDLACGVSALVLFAQLGRGRAFRSRLAFLLAATVALLGLHAVLQELRLDPVPWKVSMERQFDWGIDLLLRVTGTFGNPTYLAGYLALVLPLLLCAGVGERPGARRGALLAGWLVGCVALGLTFSRGGAVGWLAGMAVVLAGSSRWLRADLCGWRVLWQAAPRLWTGALAAAGVALVVGAVAFGPALSAAFGRLFDASARSRTYIYQGTLAMIADRPLLGFGPGTFTVHFPDYWPPRLSDIEPRSERGVSHAHSELLQVAAETGLLGLAAFSALLVVTVGLAVRALRREPLDAHWWPRLGLVAGVCGGLVESLFSVGLRYPGTNAAFWMLLGLLGSTIPVHAGFGFAEPVRRRLRWAAAVLVPLVALVLATISLRWYMADAVQLQATNALIGGDARHVALARKALELDPWLTQARYQIASAQFSAGEFEACIATCEEILAAERYYKNVATLLGSACLRAGYYARGAEMLERTVRDEPRYARGHHFRGIAYLQLAQQAPAGTEKRLHYARKAVQAFDRAWRLERDAASKDPLRERLELAQALLKQAKEHEARR